MQGQSMLQATRADWMALIALGLIWGASFLGVAIALEGLGPVWVAAARIVIGAVTLAIIAAWRGRALPRNLRVWLFAGAMGVVSNALPFTLLSWAQQYVTSGFAGITMAAIPLMVIGMAHFLVAGEQFTLRKGAGFVLGLIGVAVLIGPGILDSTGAALEGLARLACLGACLSYATGSMVTRRCPPVDPVGFGIIALGVASVIMVPLALWTEGVPELPAVRPALAVLFLGLLPTGLATLLVVVVIRGAGPSFLSQVNYHVPVWSVLLGVLVLSETLPPSFVAALGLILAGLLVSRWPVAAQARVL
jgi:drug/metabolite transporter (DMT)-like permease